MRAVVLEQHGGPDVLVIRERPTPAPRTGELLVRVRASALNRADLMQRAGHYPAPPGAPPDIPGIEFAGEIVELGRDVPPARLGERVFGIVGGGAHAEYVVVHAETAVEIPPSLDWVAAGAVPEAFITAHDALVTQAGLRQGETVLIHAVGSGVGLAAVQIARAWNALPYGTSRTADKIERARTIGLEDGVALGGSPGEMARRVTSWTAGRGVDVVLDLVGGAYTPTSLELLAPKGRLMLVGLVAGAQAQVDLRRILGRRLRIIGTVLRSRTVDEKIEATRAFAVEIVPGLAAGAMRPVVDSVFPFDAIADAHRRMESNETFGKVVLTF